MRREHRRRSRKLSEPEREIFPSWPNVHFGLRYKPGTTREQAEALVAEGRKLSSNLLNNASNLLTLARAPEKAPFVNRSSCMPANIVPLSAETKSCSY
jgi:hypothetical protein